MVRKVAVQLFDDFDGGPGDETVRFGLDGVNYEIDLSAAHAEDLRAALSKFVMCARRVGRGGLVVRHHDRAAAVPARAHRADNQAIREWARGRQIPLRDRGRIPGHVVEQYRAATGG